MKTFALQLLARLFGVGKALFLFLLPVLKDQAGKLLEVALPLARDIVASLEAKDGTGAEKRAAAVNILRTQLRLRGLQAGTQALNLAIELALAKLRAE